MKKDKKYAVAVAGAGYIGVQHIKAAAFNPRVRLAYIADSNLDMAAKLADEYSATAVDGFEKLIEIPDIDIVIIATPNEQHADQIIGAVSAGKHVLCEKPIVTTSDECTRVADIVRKSRKKVAVGHVCRFSPYFQISKNYYIDGRLGDAVFVQGTYIHRVLPPIKPWWKDTSPGSMAVIGGGCHPIDLMRWICGNIKKVGGALSSGSILGGYGVHDTVSAELVFESGCIGQLFVSLAAARPYSIDLSIYGSKGTLLSERGVVDFSLHGKDFERLPVEYKKEHPYFYEELDDLLDSIENDRNPLIDFKDGIDTVLTCLAVIQSISLQKPVEVGQQIGL